MKCTQCGAQVNGDFCPYCGAKPEAKPADNTIEQPSETPISSTPIKPVKEKKPFFKKWWFWVVAAFVVIGIIGNLGGNKSSYDEIEEFEWENMALAEMLPEPPSNKGSNLMNSDSYLSVDIQDVSKNEYKDYVNALTKFQVKSGAFIYRDKFYRELRKSVLWQYFLPINVYKITKKLFFF